MRGRTVDLMLFGTVLLWALNSTVTRYVLTHGFHPLAYATTRYAAATLLFWAFTYAREGSFRIARRDLRYVAIAAGMIFVNQLCFVYSIDKTSAAPHPLEADHTRNDADEDRRRAEEQRHRRSRRLVDRIDEAELIDEDHPRGDGDIAKIASRDPECSFTRVREHPEEQGRRG